MLDDEIVRHRRKKPSNKSKASAKSGHKHTYLPGIFEHTETYSIPDKPSRTITFRGRGFYCGECGKIKEAFSFLATKEIERFDKDYPDARIFKMDNYHKAKFIELGQNTVDK